MKRLLLIALCATALFTSCEKEETVLEEPLPPLDSDLELYVEEHTDSASSIYLAFVTTKTYSCVGPGVQYRTKIEGNNINISLGWVVGDYYCLSVEGAESCHIKLDGISNGIYCLNMTLNGETNTAQLIVTDEQFHVKVITEKNIHAKTIVLNRIPKNTIWGTVSYYNTTPEIAQSFVDSLIAMGATIPKYLPGDYDYFSIEDNGTEQIFSLTDKEAGEPPYIEFIVKYTGGMNKVNELIEEFKNKYSMFINISAKL